MSPNFLRRLKFYFIGLTLGCLSVWFFLYKNQDRNTWLPVSRIKQFISNTSPSFTKEAEKELKKLKLSYKDFNSSFWNTIEVDFNKSKTQSKPCPFYYIYGKLTNNKKIELYVEFCEFCSGCKKEGTVTIINIKKIK